MNSGLKTHPTFSLVVATLGAATHLNRCVGSLNNQTISDIEVIIVDQNDDDRVAGILTPFFSRVPLIHLKSEKGLSRARNIGLARCRGMIVGFPDDDCWFPPETLARIRGLLLKYSDVDCITGQCLSPEGHAAAARLSKYPGRVTKGNVWNRGVSASAFFRIEVVRAVGGFDESLGLGSSTPFQSGEETDLLLRLMHGGSNVYFDPSIVVLHPDTSIYLDPKSISRARAYGMGMGRVLRLHRYNPIIVGWHVAKPLLGGIGALLLGDLSLARARLNRAVGRYGGWRYSGSRIRNCTIDSPE